MKIFVEIRKMFVLIALVDGWTTFGDDSNGYNWVFDSDGYPRFE